MNLIFATRPSPLARWQTAWVMQSLQQIFPKLTCEEKIITTQGDKILDQPLPEIGGKGLFTQELENELLSGAVHCAVHSLKDLPVESPHGLSIGCVPARAEVRDVLVSNAGYSLATLPEGALVGTSSLRRAAQILAVRPDVHIQSLRGNVDTRLRKVLNRQYDAIVLAGAGLTRLGLDAYVTEWLPIEVMLPAPGQGALAVQCRTNDHDTLEMLAALEHAPTRSSVTAEREFLSALGGGCSLPVAAFAQHQPSGLLELEALVIAPHGQDAIRLHGSGPHPLPLGQALAQEALARGAATLLQFKTGQAQS